jgi:predicted amidohydrolase YtcJ
MRSRPTVPPSPEIVFKHNEGDDRLKVLGVKFVTDGSTQGFTAFLNAPYNYPKGTTNKGTFNFPLSEEKATKDNPTLLGVMRPFYNAGWQLVAHANGDAAIDKVLDAYETLFREEPALATPAARSSRRLRIEHFTVNDPDPLKMKLQLQRVHDLGVTPGMTAGHLYFWGQVFYQSILGPDRASKIHPSKSLKEKGIRFAYNSDSPITEVEPLRYVQTEGTRVPQWVPAQNPPFVLGADEISEDSVYDALRAVTLDAAYQVFFDDKVGSIEKGKLADFVVLAANPLTVPSSDIAGIKVLETYLGGERVYKQGDLCATGNRCAALLRACQPPDLGTK